MIAAANERMHGVAIDAGSGLAAALGKARGAMAKPGDLLTFKRSVLTTLGEHASTILLDSYCGPKLLGAYPPGCKPMLAFEDDVYHISGSDRITKLPSHLSISDFTGLGVSQLKFFMYYAPHDEEQLNAKKRDIVRKIGEQCRSNGVSFLMEPLVYHPTVRPGTEHFAEIKPDLVCEAVRTFSQPQFCVDTLKIEVPVDLGFIDGFGSAQRTRDEALKAFDAVGAAANGIPIVYLSAGVPFAWFEESLRMATHCDAEFSGFMCGRAIWSDGIEVFGRWGEAAVSDWLAVEGRRRLERLIAVLEDSVP